MILLVSYTCAFPQLHGSLNGQVLCYSAIAEKINLAICQTGSFGRYDWRAIYADVTEYEIRSRWGILSRPPP